MVYNPIMGMIENMQNYISVVKHLETYRAYDYAFQHGYRELGMAEPAQPNLVMKDNRSTNALAQKQLKETIAAMQLTGNLDDAQAETLWHALDALPEKSFYYEETANGNDVLNFRNENGEMVRYTIYNRPLFEAMQDVERVKQIGFFRVLHSFMSFFSQNATSRSLKFFGQNWGSDTETAINTGHGSIKKFNYPVFIAQQFYSIANILYNEAKAKRGGQYSAEYANFNLFGKIDSRYALRDTMTQKEIRNNIYANNSGVDAARVADAAWNILKSPVTTTEALSSLLENSTRYTVFRLTETQQEKQNGSTYSDLLRRGRAAREATTDFSKVGTSKVMQYAKMVVPFIGATTQGIFKTVRLWSSDNAGHRASMAARMVMNALIPNLIMAVIRNALWDDDEKEAWENMSFYEKNKYWHFKLGDGWFVRVKRSQDTFIQAVDALGVFLGDVLTGYEGDAWGNLMATSKEIVSNAMIDYNPIWAAISDAQNNKTWYGGAIDNYYDLRMAETERYDADTSFLSRAASTALSGLGVNWSPKRIDYVAQQYLGSMGMIGGDFIKAAFGGTLDLEEVGDILYNRVGKAYVMNATLNAGLSSSFYTAADQITQVTTEVNQHNTTSLLRSNLTNKEKQDAVDEAAAMTKKGGIIYETKNAINELYKEKDSIASNENMTREDRTKKLIAIQDEINKLALKANAAMADYWNRYGYPNNAARAASNFSNLMGWTQKTEYVPRTDYDRLPDVFKEAADTREMKFAQAAWEASADDPSARKSTLLPHPQTGFTKDKTKYEMEGAGQEAYNKAYWIAYSDYLTDKPLEATDDPDKQEEWLNAAHKKGMAAGQAAYLKWLDQQQ